MGYRHMKNISFALLLFLLPMLGACSVPARVYPPYQPTLKTSSPLSLGKSEMPTNPDSVPIAMAVYGSFALLTVLASGGSAGSVEQGYQDVQIDEDTYVVSYINYISRSRSDGQQMDPYGDKWIKGAQEYVLYRAGELAKSKGAQYFAILHQDDWNILSTWSTPNDVQPGAGLVIRLLNSVPSAIQSNDSRVYDVEVLLQTLTEINRGLAEYANKTSPDEWVQKSWKDFRRWRASVNRDSVKLTHELTTPQRSRIDKDQTGAFQITTWEDKFGPISPLQFLWQCVTLARQEGLRTFKLENWFVQEQETDGTLWFITTAKIVPNYQKPPQSIEPVFKVDELFVNAQARP